MNRPERSAFEAPAVDMGALLQCARDACARRDFRDAARLYREALTHGSCDVDTYVNLGVAHHLLEEYVEAAAAFRGALTIDPAHTLARANLAAACVAVDDYDGAIACYRRAIEIDSGDVAAHVNLGLALGLTQQYTAAAESLGAAARLHPNSAEIHHQHGAQLFRAGKLNEATVALERALALNPQNAQIAGDLSVVLYSGGNSEGAANLVRAHIERGHEDPNNLNNLGLSLKEIGNLDEAVSAFRRGLELDPRNHALRSNLLLTLHYAPFVSPEELAAEHRVLGTYHADNLQDREHSISPDPERPLRVGYLSPDFRAHSVSRFIEPVLRHHDRTRVDVYAYSACQHPDEVTARLRSYISHWRDVSRLNDDALARQILADRIDVLVDLAGHTADSRCLVLARKLAPVQVTYLGYPNGTGLDAVGYRITDEWADPPGTTEHLHVERLLRLPGGFLCFEPPAEPILPSSPPALRTGHVTFGSFNLLAKVTEEVVRVWSRILTAVPDSRMVLKSAVFLQDSTRHRVRERFARHGIEASRIDLLGRTPGRAAHLEQYATIDIALDPFPYHGTTTSCEALWMGVPVVTLAGRHHASRVGVSILGALGVEEWIAQSEEEYVGIATRMAANRALLVAHRFRLRERMRTSRLMDGSRIARELENAYREAWCDWCAGQTHHSTRSLSAFEHARRA